MYLADLVMVLHMYVVISVLDIADTLHFAPYEQCHWRRKIYVHLLSFLLKFAVVGCVSLSLMQLDLIYCTAPTR